MGLIDPPVTPQSCSINVAYLVSRFPKLSETFVLYEFLALQSNPDHSQRLTLFAIKEEHEALRHDEASKLLPAVVYRSPWQFQTWLQAFKTAVTSPRKTLQAIAGVVRLNLRSPRFLVTSLVALPSALALACEMRKCGIDHIHAHFANVATTTAYVIHKLTGIPFSFTAHGSDLHRDQTMLGEKIAAATSAIAVSAFNAEVMRQHSSSDMHHKIEVIYCGTDLSTFAPDPAQKRVRLAPLPLTRVRIGCLGTLLEVKGQRYLLEALAQLPAMLPSSVTAVSCTLIGDGPQRPALEQLAATLGVEVEFAGALTRDQVAARLKEFDIVVVPSVPTNDGRKEGIPVSLMEAMASGAAVVASNLTGIPELVIDEQTGLLVPPADSGQLAAAIARFAADGQLRVRCSEAGRTRVAAEFDLQINARELARRFTGQPQSSDLAAQKVALS